MRIGNYVIEASLRSLHPWTHLRNHKYEHYSHFVWGKLSVIYGRPGLTEMTVCEYCGDEAYEEGYSIGDDWDSITMCEGCGIVEGHTETITLDEYERRQA